MLSAGDRVKITPYGMEGTIVEILGAGAWVVVKWDKGGSAKVPSLILKKVASVTEYG